MNRLPVVFLVMFGLLAGLFATAAPARATPEPELDDPRPVVWGVTDSVFWAAAPFLDERLPDHQPLVRGYPGLHIRTVLGLQLTKEEPLPPGEGALAGPDGLMVNDADLFDDIVVVALGNMFWGDDAADPGRYERWINEFLDHTDQVRRVLWIRPRNWDEPGSPACGPETPYECNQWMRIVNDMLDRAATRHPNVELLDWGAEVAGHEDEWITPDGIHLMGIEDGSQGVGAMADFVADAILDSPFPGLDKNRENPRRLDGRLNKVRVGPKRIVAKGYAYRIDNDRSVLVTITVDGDVAVQRKKAIPLIGLADRTEAHSDNHGFRIRLPVPPPGQHTVCLWVGASRVKQNCKQITIE